MTKYCNSEDVYKELVDDSTDSWLYGLLSFAVIEEQRIEWMKHRLDITGTKPSIAEINLWYESLPPGALLRAKGMAEETLLNYSKEVVSEFEDETRKEIEQGLILSEIREGRRFLPALGMNIVGGVVSSIIFGALLIIVAWLVLNDSSPVDIGAHAKHALEVGSEK